MGIGGRATAWMTVASLPMLNVNGIVVVPSEITRDHACALATLVMANEDDCSMLLGQMATRAYDCLSP